MLFIIACDYGGIDRYSSVMLEMVYPRDTTLSVTSRVWHQSSDTDVTSDVIPASASVSSCSSCRSGPAYYWNDSIGSVLRTMSAWFDSEVDPGLNL